MYYLIQFITCMGNILTFSKLFTSPTEEKVLRKCLICPSLISVYYVREPHPPRQNTCTM